MCTVLKIDKKLMPLNNTLAYKGIFETGKITATKNKTAGYYKPKKMFHSIYLLQYNADAAFQFTEFKTKLG